MKTDEDTKDTIDEEDEIDEDEKKDMERLKATELSEIKGPDDLKAHKGLKFNKEKCVECNLLEENEDMQLYSNLYPIKFEKYIEIFEYPFEIYPACHEENIILKIIRQTSPEIFKDYGYYYRSGNNIYAVKNVKEEKRYKVVVVYKGWLQYTVTIKNSVNSSKIEKGQKGGLTPIQEKVLFLVIREILSANPYVHFDRDCLYLENVKEEVNSENNTYYIHDGYKISLQQADIGICLIIGIKNKIKGKFTVYDFLSNKEEENEPLIGRKFIPFEGSRSQIISYIDLDKNPVNTMRNYRQETFSYFNYYKKIWNVEIKHKDQPLIEVEVKDTQNKISPKYYVPELCYLVGIDDEDMRENQFMKQVIEKTRLDPDKKIEQIEKCIDLFISTDFKSKHNDAKGENFNTIYGDEKYTSQKKLEGYGIVIDKLENKPIKPYYVSQPTFNNETDDNLTVEDVCRILPVGRDYEINNNWICLYTKQAEKISFDLLKGFKKCCKAYNLKFKDNDSNWIPMKSQNAKDWIDTVENELYHRKNCKCVLFLLNNKTDKLYISLKKHSLCQKGYVSQVIKMESILKAMNNKNRKGPDSYFSKILLQINCKLGGSNYFLNIDETIDERNIILMGIDSSHTWGRKNSKRNNKQTGVAMVATKDKKFSKFYSKEEIIKYDKHYSSATRRNIAGFIEEVYNKYKKENKEAPKNIIIYRQGIAHNQLDHIKLEVFFIEEMCRKLGMNYYYVLVNTRSSVKFFEKKKMNAPNKKSKIYKNPEQGLIILDQITNLKRFEFYIQPQKVNIGSATPTYFHVAYGNIGFPEILIKLTYWTTYIYPNWQNAIRVPHVIKLAEKLANITAKFTQSKLNKNLCDEQAFL